MTLLDNLKEMTMEFEKLVKNLSNESKELFEKSIALASSRSHFYIDVEHWLTEALAEEQREIIAILKHFNVDVDRVHADLDLALENTKTGNDGFPKISPDIVRLLFEAWMIASSQYASVQVLPVHILLALVDSAGLKTKIGKISKQFEAINGEEIRTQCESLLRGEAPQDQSEATTQKLTKTPSLDQFTTNLTQQAKDGKIDSILGRDDEIRQIIDVLCRRKQNNPILTGEAGVGKTAVVEGLAVKIAQGDVPTAIENVEIRSLDLGLLQAGAGVKGEFENRLKNVIKEVQQSVQPIILFIDEAHTLIGAGNQAGSGDAANLLKPALARGELRTIAATTWAEYKKYFESDAALTRRFQVVKVEEPSVDKAIIMLRNAAPTLEQHHKVVILDAAVSASVNLSHRYIPGRQLPDKCVSLLDTACARVNLSQNTTPARIVQYSQEIKNIEFEIDRLNQEAEKGYEHSASIVELEVKKVGITERYQSLCARWEQEKQIINQINSAREKAEAEVQNSDNEKSATDLKNTLIAELRAKLKSISGSQPLIYECVDEQVVAEVVADWTGIPVGRMQSDEIQNVLSLEQTMEKRVIGQSHGLKLISKAVQTARAKLSDPKRPLGVFMLVGPSGVGKTETALTLAEQLYGSEQNMTVINMSEFKEEHKVSMLMGSPPGYVGYGEGGVLTEAVRRKPYSVVLLDEMEKAHPGVQDIFYQVFDKGILRDGEGRDIDFKNTVIIMTSNTASAQIEQLCIDPETKPEPKALLEAIEGTLRETYKPAFLGRINLIPYYPLDEQCLSEIAVMQLHAIQQRVETNYKVELNYSDKLVEHVVSLCAQSDTGARKISALLNNTLLPVLAEKILTEIALDKALESVEVDVSEEGEFVVKINSKKENTDDMKIKKTVTG